MGVYDVDILIANQRGYLTQLSSWETIQVGIDELNVQRLVLDPGIGPTNDCDLMPPLNELPSQEFAVVERTVNLLTRNDLQDVQPTLQVSTGSLTIQAA